MTYNLITTTDFRQNNPGLDLSRYDDTTLSGVITRATAKAEEYCDTNFLYQEYTDEKNLGNINAVNDLVIYTNNFPIDTVSAISIVKGSFNADINLSTSNYDIDSRGTEIAVAGESITLDAVTLLDFANLKLVDFYTKTTYTAGYQLDQMPQVLKDAVNLYARDEVTRSLNVGGASSIRQGGVTISYSNAKGKSDNVLDAEALLSSFRRVTGW